MSNQHVMPPNSMDTQFTEGTPVYDLNGEQVGTVSKQSHVANVLILHKGIFFHRDIQVPLTTVQRSDSQGIYLSVSKDDLQHEHSAVSRATTESGEGSLISRGTDIIERNPDTITKGTDVIERNPNTVTQGVDVIERNPDTITQGTDTIERNAEG